MCIKCGIMLYQSQATVGLCDRCPFSKIVLRHISPWLCVNSSMNHYQVSVLIGVVQHPLRHCHGGHVVTTWAQLITACATTLCCEPLLLIPASLEHHEFRRRGHKGSDDTYSSVRTTRGSHRDLPDPYVGVGWNINKSGVQCLLGHPVG